MSFQGLHDRIRKWSYGPRAVLVFVLVGNGAGVGAETLAPHLDRIDRRQEQGLKREQSLYDQRQPEAGAGSRQSLRQDFTAEQNTLRQQERLERSRLVPGSASTAGNPGADQQDRMRYNRALERQRLQFRMQRGSELTPYRR